MSEIDGIIQAERLAAIAANNVRIDDMHAPQETIGALFRIALDLPQANVDIHPGEIRDAQTQDEQNATGTILVIDGLTFVHGINTYTAEKQLRFHGRKYPLIGPEDYGHDPQYSQDPLTDTGELAEYNRGRYWEQYLKRIHEHNPHMGQMISPRRCEDPSLAEEQLRTDRQKGSWWHLAYLASRYARHTLLRPVSADAPTRPELIDATRIIFKFFPEAQLQDISTVPAVHALTRRRAEARSVSPSGPGPGLLGDSDSGYSYSPGTIGS